MGYLRREDINLINDDLFFIDYKTDLTGELKEEIIQFALDEEGDKAGKRLYRKDPFMWKSMNRAIIAAYAMGMTDKSVTPKISKDEKQAIIDDIGVSHLVQIVGEFMPGMGEALELCYQWGVKDTLNYIIEKR